MGIIIEVLKVFAIICVAFIVGKVIAKIKLPAILGWLIVGVVFGPYLAGIVDQTIIDSLAYKIFIKLLECFAGVLIGKEIIFKKLKSSGKQIIGITFIQSLGTFVLVSLIFLIVFIFTNTPLYLAFVFGGIALATAPAPALAITNEYHTDGPVTKTLIPLAALDDVIGVVVFFTVISIINASFSSGDSSIFLIVLSIILPFVIGILLGLAASGILKHLRNEKWKFFTLILSLIISLLVGLIFDKFIFNSFSLNYLIIGMSFTTTLVNLVEEDKLKTIFNWYKPILNFSLIVVIVNLGMPLDYRLIFGAGIFTAVYILSRASGKILFSFIGGKITKADKNVTKYLGFTLLPHSGVSLIFTGIAATTLNTIDPSLASIVQGTICAAALINEIIAVILAKFAFKWAHELNSVSTNQTN
ncbi:MAG: cation:proton antiporter [Bacilli bacterium]